MSSSIFKAHILTLFPELFPGPMGHSITGRALSEGKWSCTATDIRDFATDKRKTVDDTPYGGGAGMVMRADVVAEAIEHAKKETPNAPVVFMTPTGTPFNQGMANRWAAGEGVILLCGHYEGIDQRVLDALVDEEVSIGDYVLTGGEIAVYPGLDATIRQLPGVLGNDETLAEESFSPALEGLLEYPHYTRPEEWRGQTVPEVLKSGHHAKIDAWRKEQSIAKTQKVRPELLKKK
ncbi:MAG: tRNA (guanosine(37)-N1)-methyltransferase TrmD [Magnetococcales bacterium]|nr:tRNA (guanosine(37)-N1)-methyltransferase TrmD [Magnetococcales bacterium]